MGEGYMIANALKRQYITPAPFLDELNVQWYPRAGGLARALALLVCDHKAALGLEAPAGSWCGDHVVLVHVSIKPGHFGIPTATPEDPRRNLFQVARQEYEDISYKAIAMVCDRDEAFADRLARKVVVGPWGQSKERPLEWALLELGYAVEATGSYDLAKALDRHVGEDWREKFEEVRKQQPHFLD